VGFSLSVIARTQSNESICRNDNLSPSFIHTHFDIRLQYQTCYPAHLQHQLHGLHQCTRLNFPQMFSFTSLPNRYQPLPLIMYAAALILSTVGIDISSDLRSLFYYASYRYFNQSINLRINFAGLPIHTIISRGHLL
jgi:hypothetical protein